MFELAGDVAGSGKGEAGQHRAGPVGAEAPRKPVRAVRRDEQQHDDEQVEGRGGRSSRTPSPMGSAALRRAEGRSTADSSRPALSVTNQLADQDTVRELAVEDVGREVSSVT